jgi:CRISPR-associated protein Cmr4
MKTTSMLYLFTRTPLHVGAGSSVGAIDMPIQRERHTQIPIIPGSSLKGVLRDLWPKKSGDQYELFGPEGDEDEHYAGSLLVGEARVVCFPVRSAKGSFAWLTSPLALQRYARDTGKPAATIPDLKDEECLAGPDVVVRDNQVVLEEYCFTSKGTPAAAVALLKDALPGDSLWATLAQRLVVVSDGIFSHFCASACEVQQRIRINDETGTVDQGGLFNQENVPSETLFYAVMGQRDANKKGLGELKKKLDEVKVLQIGADETIGLGFCSVYVNGGAA